ncbi:MAG: 5'-nucleotidase C-terminal domain-containing protein [Treponema sp.]|nr:5'-nucleotidase C-terminal domain-containing protein [Treponema sp.]
MEKTIKITAVFVIIFLLPVICSCTASDDPVKLTIIHINDTHGRTHAEPYISQMTKNFKLNGENVLVLDAGDRIHGQIAANLSQGESIAAIMNAAGYDAMVTGNHEFNFGVDRLIELSGMMNFPILAANIRNSNGERLFKPYEVFRLNGVTVGVFGIATPETITKSDPRTVAGLTFDDPVSSAAEMVEALKAEGCGIIIALVHLGDENSTADGHRSDALAAVPGIDIIIDGHSHTFHENGRVVGNTLIAQTGDHGRYIGVIEITYLRRVLSKTAGTIAVTEDEIESGLISDETVIKIITEEESKIESVTSAIIGYTPFFLEGEREAVRTRDTNMANILTDSMKHATGADISFMTGGNIRSSIPAGNITMGHVLTVLPFSNLLVTIELDGADILEVLEHGVSRYPEAAGQYIQVSGINVEFDPHAQPMSRVTSVIMADGSALDETKTYSAATIEFIAAGGDGYTMLKGKSNVVYYGGDAEAFAAYLAANPVIGAVAENRVLTR